MVNSFKSSLSIEIWLHPAISILFFHWTKWCTICGTKPLTRPLMYKSIKFICIFEEKSYDKQRKVNAVWWVFVFLLLIILLLIFVFLEFSNSVYWPSKSDWLTEYSIVWKMFHTVSDEIYSFVCKIKHFCTKISQERWKIVGPTTILKSFICHAYTNQLIMNGV